MRDPDLTLYAKAMRREPTQPETRLWLELRGKRFAGVKFRHQKVIGPYVVDFSSRNPMLVIELDGDSHANRERYDSRRTAFLEEQGYRVLRFTNTEVIINLEGVLEALSVVLQTPPLPALSPEGERAT